MVAPLLLEEEEIRMLDAMDDEESIVDGSSSNRRLAVVIAISGGIAGAVSHAITNPMDLVRTRMVLNQDCYGERTALRVLVQVARKEGVRALWKGALSRILAALPSSAISSFTYELALRLSLKKLKDD